MTPEASAKRVELDMCGQICPSSLLSALKEISTYKEELKKGELMITFKTDNRDATVTIPVAVVNMGYAVRVEKNDTCYEIVISKKEQ